MAFNPMDFFEAGEKVGKSRKSPFNYGAEGVLDQFKTNQDTKAKLAGTLGMQMALKKYENELPMNPKEKAMTDYYKASTDALRGGSGSQEQDIESMSQESGIPAEDYILKPTVTRYKGQTKVVNTPELKQPMPESGAAIIRGGRQSALGLVNNLHNMTPEIKKEMGPVLLGHIGAMKGHIGDVTLNLRSALGDNNAKQFSNFKSQSDILFQNFRKFITGVQAAYPEIQMLTPDYPQPTDTPEVYTTKAMGLVDMAERVEQQVLDLESQRGYRTGDLRKGSLHNNPLIQSSYNQYGQAGQPRADMAQDASVTSNQPKISRKGVKYSIIQ